MKMRRNQLVALLLAMVVALSCMQMPTAAAADTSDSGAIESAFTDAAFLQAVREIVGKTNGEHIYRSDVENITKLKVVSLHIKNLDGIEYFTALKELYCYNNDICTLNLSHNPNLEAVDCSFNIFLDALDLSNCSELRTLDCNYSALQELDLRKNPKLTSLVCFSTDLRTLNVSNNVLLETLDTYDTCLESLDVSNNTELEYLYCGCNQLTSIDVSKNPALKELDCSENKLTGLDLTNNPALEYLWCFENYMGDDPELAISGLVPLLPKLGEPSLMGDSWWSEHFVYYPQEAAEETPSPTPSPTPTPTPSPTPTPTPIPPQDETNPFTDVQKSDWFYDEVMAAYRDGLMIGVSGHEFAPQTEITRGMFVTVLYRMEGEPQTALAYSFTDVPENEYFAKAVAWAGKHGIVEGYSERQYAPYQAITREEMAAILYRYANYKQLGTDTDYKIQYADGNAISEFAVDAVKWVTANRIMEGYEDHSFRPRDTTVRAEAAAVFGRLYALQK